MNYKVYTLQHGNLLRLLNWRLLSKVQVRFSFRVILPSSSSTRRKPKFYSLLGNGGQNPGNSPPRSGKTPTLVYSCVERLRRKQIPLR